MVRVSLSATHSATQNMCGYRMLHEVRSDIERDLLKVIPPVLGRMNIPLVPADIKFAWVQLERSLHMPDLQIDVRLLGITPMFQGEKLHEGMVIELKNRLIEWCTRNNIIPFDTMPGGFSFGVCVESGIHAATGEFIYDESE